MGFHSKGWREAAEQLETSYAHDRFDKGNYLPYALVGIWRHAVELQMKEILNMARKVNWDTGISTKKLWDTHDLALLARGIRKMLLVAGWGGGVPEQWEVCVAEFEAWEKTDPKGFMLRYAFDKEGELYKMVTGRSNVHFERALNLCHAAANLLDGIDAGVEAAVEQMEDALREYEVD